jgi:TP901 family phage tail tape measure protein
MAKKITNDQLFAENLFDPTIQKATEMLEVLKQMRGVINDSLKDQKKILTEIKSVSSVTDLRNQQKAVADVDKATQRALKIKQDEAKLEALLGKAKQELGKAMEKEQKALVLNTRLQREQLKLQQDKARIDAKLAKEAEKKNSLYAQESARLNDLRKRYKDLALANQENSKEARNMLKEITALDKKLKDVDASVGQYQRNVGNYSSAFRGLGSGIMQLTGFVGGVAVLRDAIKTVTEFDQAMAELQTITGLSDEVIDELGEKAIEMSKRFGTSAIEVSKGMALIGSKKPDLLNNADALASVTEQADILAKAAGISLPEAADALTKAMNQYGASSTEATKYTDILAVSQQKGTASIASLSEALKNVGSVAKASGVDFEATNALLQALAKGGLEGAEAGTKLRTILLRLAKTGRQDLNPAVTDMSDILNTLAKEIPDVTSAQKMFGEEAAAAALTLINQRDVVKDLNGALNEQGAALEQAENNSDTLSGVTAKLGAAWDAFVLSIENGDGVIARFVRGSLLVLADLLDMLTGYTFKLTGIETRVSKTSIEQTVAERQKIIDDLVQKGAITVEEGAKRMEGAYEDVIRNVIRAETIWLNQNKELLKDANLGLAERNNILAEIKRGQQTIIDAEALLSEKQKATKDTTEELTGAYSRQTKEIKKLQEAKALELERDLTPDEKMKLELDFLEEQSKRRKTELIKNVQDEEQLREELYQLERNQLLEQIAIKEKYDKDATDERLKLAELERAHKEKLKEQELEHDKNIEDQKTKNAEEEAAERLRIAQQYADAASELADMLTDYLIKKSEEREAAIDKEISAAEKRQERLRELADQGVLDAEQSLAAEDKKIAEFEKKKIEEERRRQRIEQANAVFQSYTGHVEAGDPNPLASTIKDIVALRAFIESLPGFYTGTESIGENNATPFKVSGRDRFLVRLDEGERVLTAEQNARIGNLSNEMLTRIVEGHNKKAAFASAVLPISVQDSGREVAEEIRALRQEQREKPVQWIDIDGFKKEVVENIKQGDKIVRNHYKRNLL